MVTERKHRLIEIEWPEFGEADPPPHPEADVYQSRIDAVRSRMGERDLTHVIVYGDREHFANLAYLTGFDPRFEEALLIVSLTRMPLLVVGNECEGYLPISPLYVAGRLRSERFQPFSLLNQPRESSRFLSEILSDEGIELGSRVGCVGWKYFHESEHPSGIHTIDLPSYIADTLRDLSGYESVVNATDVLMHPDYGLRAACSADEIAYLEYSNVVASEGMRRMLTGLREGMTDHELASLSGYAGLPLGCHMTLATGERGNLGLSSPSGQNIRRGDRLSTNVCYWGSNICRAGWVAEGPSDLPEAAQDYVPAFAGPYLEAVACWFDLLRIGTPGGELSRLIAEMLPYDRYGITLNAGHLIHLDEWLSSPIYPGSDIALQSGMAIQVDIIPDSPVYFSTRVEDGVVLADAALRAALRARYPSCYERCQARRTFMAEVLGLELPVEVLPLSNIPGIVPPFLLHPNLVLALEA